MVFGCAATKESNRQLSKTIVMKLLPFLSAMVDSE
jgi:hypothetical protein